MSEMALPPVVVKKAVAEMNRLGHHLRLLHQAVNVRQKRKSTTNNKNIQQLQAELGKAAAENQGLRHRWREALTAKLDAERQLDGERRYGVWQEIVGLRASLDATSIELRMTKDKLEEARAANDGHELRLAQWLRSFDEAAQATHEATRMASQWREAAEKANEEVSKLRVQLQGRKSGQESPQQASVAPATDDVFYDADEDVGDEPASTLAAPPGPPLPHKKRRQRDLHRQEDEARARLTAEEAYSLDVQRERMMAAHLARVPASSSTVSSPTAPPPAATGTSARTSPAPAAAGAPERTPFPYQVGQIISGAEVVGVWPQFGAMLELRGAKKWLNNWLPDGAQLKVGDRADVRIKSIRTENRKVVLELFDMDARTGNYQ